MLRAEGVKALLVDASDGIFKALRGTASAKRELRRPSLHVALWRLTLGTRTRQSHRVEGEEEVEEEC